MECSHLPLGAHCTLIISFFIYWLQLCNYLYKRNHTAGFGGGATAHCGLKTADFLLDTQAASLFFP